MHFIEILKIKNKTYSHASVGAFLFFFCKHLPCKNERVCSFLD